MAAEREQRQKIADATVASQTTRPGWAADASALGEEPNGRARSAAAVPPENVDAQRRRRPGLTCHPARDTNAVGCGSGDRSRSAGGVLALRLSRRGGNVGAQN